VTGPAVDHEKYRALYTLGSTMTFNTLIEADRLANLAVSMLVEFTDAHRGHLVLFDEEGQIRPHFGLETGEALRSVELPLDLAGRLGALHGETIARVVEEERSLSVPLVAEEAAVGALRLERELADRPFTTADRALVEACATHLAQSLRSRRLYEVHLAQRRRAELLDRVSRAVNLPGDLEETLSVVLRAAAEALAASSGALILGDAAGRLGIAASHHMGDGLVDTETRPAESRLTRWVFSEGTPFCDGRRLAAPVRQVVRDRRVFQERRRSIHGSPFLRTLGVLYLEQPAGVRHFNEEDVLTLRVFADHAAAAITNNSLVQQASTDPLTQLDSRLQLETRLKEEVEFARRHGVPISLIMIDVDHFKKVNDTHGHQVGDEVLCDLARILKEAIRSNDACARYGGEEFTVILPETHLAGAQVVAENIRSRVEGRSLSRERLKVTVSLGVAEYPLHSNTVEGLLRRADQALYRAKEAGRNCCRAAPAI
jgi:diguanylate cyclase (GGDEF)-like protein